MRHLPIMSQSRGPATLQLNIWRGGGRGEGEGAGRIQIQKLCVCLELCICPCHGWWLGGETRQGLKSSSFVQSDIYGIDAALVLGSVNIITDTGGGNTAAASASSRYPSSQGQCAHCSLVTSIPISVGRRGSNSTSAIMSHISIFPTYIHPRHISKD